MTTQIADDISLPWSDEQDFEDAHRGFVAAMTPCVVRDASGKVVWDNDSYAFLEGDAPPTVHPSLWRQSKLTAVRVCSKSCPASTRCGA